MRERRWLLPAVYGLLVATAVSGALKATRPKFKIATTSTTTSTTEEPNATDAVDGEVETTTSGDVNATTARVLTGIPQIDYIWDPNLPRELNGYNLSEYPFYNSIPEEIDFKCDGLHDGFYASVIHKCQVYHHCLYGTRYDFLCANFTAFDQKTFICHFASEVDCANSKKYWHRNDALYKAAETTTLSTTSTSTTTVSTTTTAAGQSPPGPRPGARRRRPYRRRPAYDYYEEDYYDEETYERTRPRGYDRPRDDYDYEDRKYPRRDRDRDRNFRDRDYRDREIPRSREPERSVKDELLLAPRERFPARNNRRDPMRSGPPRDPILDDEPRNRNRDQDPPSRIRDTEEPDERRPLDSRNREVDDRRYNDKGYADDYEDETVASGPASASGGSDVLVKPVAPPSSVYSRPRAPPKIRRPVPITEQEKFAYKATPAPLPAPVEARRRPVETPAEDDYYEDELEDVRPRRPANRRRPGFRDFYENPRERDRPFRPRYREEGDEVRPRKYPERNRDRYYERGPERGRDRSLDRPKDRGAERIPEAGRERPTRIQEADRGSSGRPADREHELDRPRSSLRSKEPPESPETTKRPNVFERTSTTPATTSTDAPKDTASHDLPRNRQETPGGKNTKQETQRPSDVREPETERLPTRFEDEARDDTKDKSRGEADDYSSVDDEYDEPEYNPPPPPPPPPRTAVRIVKRPFLPSRGGNPNPRGLSPVGSKAPESSRKEESSNRSPPVKTHGHSDGYQVTENRESLEDKREKSSDERRPYDAYKSIHKDLAQKTRSEDYEEVLTRPAPRRPEVHREIPISGHSQSGQGREDSKSRVQDEISRGPGSRIPSGSGKYAGEEENGRAREKSSPKWSSDDYRVDHRGEARREQEANSGSQSRGKSRLTESSGYYGPYGGGNGDQQTTLQSENAGTSKQTSNEVVTQHRLQDIPESEYDVTLNEALTPSFNAQEANLPSGFVLPIHRQLVRDPVLQSTENSYKISRPYNQQLPTQSQQQKPFVPSPQFLSLAGGISPTSGERSRSVQYFRTPEAVHVTGPQYRHQRGPWHDYTGY